MQILAGIALIALGLLSGGAGIAMMGSALSIPSLLVVSFGGFLVLNHYFGTKFKGTLKKILGLLLIVFGLINLRIRSNFKESDSLDRNVIQF